MSPHSTVSASIALLLLTVIRNAIATSCNYATFSVRTLYPSLSVGTFSLSTNRCQSVKAKMAFEDDFLGIDFSLPFDGSLKLQCYEYAEDYYQIIVNLYDDPLCNDLIEFQESDSTNSDDGAVYVDMENNNKFTIYDSIQFSLDDMNCDSYQDETACGISVEMANDCSWAQSERYINISVPDSHCVSLAPDFHSILSMIPSEIVADEFAENLETSALKMQCCSVDNSLLISNYSDVTCSNEPDSQFRISPIYNGECFVIGDNEDFIDSDYADYYYYADLDENSESSFVFILKWTCNEFVDDCSDIPIVDDTFLPQECSQECLLNEQEEEANSNQGRSGASSTGLTGKSTKIIALILAIVCVSAVFVIVLVGAALYGRRKALQNQMEGNMAENVIVSQDKYKAFVSDAEPQDMNVVHVEAVDADPTVQ